MLLTLVVTLCYLYIEGCRNNYAQRIPTVSTSALFSERSPFLQSFVSVQFDALKKMNRNILILSQVYRTS